ncbi:hypothetical protein D7V88_28010 [Corallococcus terminator]|uniref:Uncharacterized protein n=1 Tax=Corallococcus terminator TaxID=2316733 RepID=A0A3A8IJD9_9BACT|nr:hypothetical protein D7V88_28010 [Corallococcus terminator]
MAASCFIWPNCMARVMGFPAASIPTTCLHCSAVGVCPAKSCLFTSQLASLAHVSMISRTRARAASSITLSAPATDAPAWAVARILTGRLVSSPTDRVQYTGFCRQAFEPESIVCLSSRRVRPTPVD